MTSDAAVDKMPSPSSVAELTLKQEIQGKVVKVELAGAFVDIGADQLGFLHISQLSTKRVNNVTDVVKEGDSVTVYVLDLNRQNNRVSLTLIKPPAYLWTELENMVGRTVTGKVIRLEKFGAFVDIGAERPGLIHISELSDDYVGSPDAVVKVEDEVEARIIGVDVRKKQIDLSLKAATTPIYEEDEAENEELTAMALALKKAMGSNNQKSKKQRGKKDRHGGHQEEIFSRTLQYQRKK